MADPAFRLTARVPDPGLLGPALRAVRWRKLRRRLRLPSAEPMDVDAAVASTTPPGVTGEMSSVHALAARLSTNQRVVWPRRRLDQRKLEEITEYTGYSLVTVRGRLGRAEQLFERALQRGRRP